MTYAATVLADSPTSYWRLDDTTTPLVDQKGVNTLSGVVATTTLNQAGLLTNDSDAAVLLSGVGGAASSGPIYNPTALSWEAWIKPSSVSATVYQRVVGLGQGPAATVDDAQLAIGGGSGWAQWSVNTGAPITSPAGVIVAGQTTHLVGTSDNATNTINLYVNGLLVATGTGTHYTGYTASNLLLGSTSSVYSAAMQGILDEVAFYQTVLSPAQVLAHYQAGIDFHPELQGVFFPFCGRPSAGSGQAGGATVNVSRTPLGPAVPASGWSAVMADGFSTSGPALGASGSYWGKNRDSRDAATGLLRPGFNPNEVAIFDSTLPNITSSGLILPATFDSGCGSRANTAYPSQGFETAANYRSGCLWSSPSTAFGGAPGFAGITGFLWTPVGLGAKTCFEAVIQQPFNVSTTQGSDMAWWCSAGAGDPEFDFPEMALILNGFTIGGSAIWAVWNHGTNQSAQIQNFNTPSTYDAPTYMTDGAFHTYTCVVDDAAKTVEMYVDGMNITGSPFSYSSVGTLLTTPMGFYLSYGFRNNGGSQTPSFTGTVNTVVRSAAVYQDTAHAGAGITGGGVQIGTVLV